MSALSFSFPADIFGILGLITTIAIYQQNTNKHQLLWKLATDVVWILYYIFHQNYSVVAITLVAILRSLVLLCHEKKWAQGKYWMYIFMGISIAFSLAAWKDWTTLLTLTSSLICIAMYWAHKPKVVRFATVPAALFFIANVLINQNWIGLISESFMLVSTLVGIVRFDILKKDPAKK